MSGTELVPVEGELMPAKHDDFTLEPDVEKGKLPQRVIDELIHCRTIAKDYAQAYADAVKAQAEKYGIPVGAVKRYIAWLADDKMADGRNEVDALERLMDATDA